MRAPVTAISIRYIHAWGHAKVPAGTNRRAAETASQMAVLMMRLASIGISWSAAISRARLWNVGSLLTHLTCLRQVILRSVGPPPDPPVVQHNLTTKPSTWLPIVGASATRVARPPGASRDGPRLHACKSLTTEVDRHHHARDD